jgi:hypothetical protein
MATSGRSAIRVFGFNAWHLEHGTKVNEFPDEDAIRDYIRVIKSDPRYCGGRCRHYTSKWAYQDDVAVLLVEWHEAIYGHFDIREIVMPSDDDKNRYAPLKKGGRVYVVDEAALYPTPVTLKDLQVILLNFRRFS